MSSRSKLAPHIRSMLRFDRAPPVVPWLEENIVVPASMSPRSPGPFRVGSRPQMAPILECFNPNSGVRDITLSAGTQLFKTTIGVLGACYLLKNAPGPMLIAGPSEDWTREEISKKRLRALIDENHILSVEKPYNQDDYKLMHMGMIGMPIDLVGANSPTALAGSTRRYVIIEEASKIQHTEHEDAPEAHPIKNAMERTKDFAGLDLHYISSTPNSPHHIFWQRFLAGTQTVFLVKCPHCSGMFPFEWIYPGGHRESIAAEFFKNAPADYCSVTWDKDARSASGVWNDERVRQSARFICPHHGCEITDEQRFAMLGEFEEHSENRNAAGDHRSFRVPSFYSRRISIGDIALKFLDRGDLFTTGLQTFYNSWLALPWEAHEVNVKTSHALALRAQGELAYRKGTIPKKPLKLIVTADPGETSGTHWMVSAVMPDHEIYVIDWGDTVGIEDLEKPSTRERWEYPIIGTEKKMRPHRGLIDSRYATDRVYDLCARSRMFFWPTRGSDASTGFWTESPISSRPGMTVFVFVDHTLKTELYQHRIFQQRPPRIYLPTDTGPELIAQLSGQQLVDRKWKRLPNDHWGDCLKQVILDQWIAQPFERTGL